ncbi:Calcineurin-like metallo-phosphoesterase superfamily protein [Striga hermonthica]|uniref:Calcineurin-like metallo-phosphoesterase superfamily protein n=1 Tax=Striga hermonthica TaxID=68872 RepID=A0A9N7NTX5_STRHE|nr:Calcineurin-like metallo-phosphoesterase superfamily protein [Striga hermonthica]
MASLPFGRSWPLQKLCLSPQNHRALDAVCCCAASTASTPHNLGRVGASSGTLEPIVVNGHPPTFVSAPGRRIIAVGDLHGDLDKTRYALQMAGVLSADGEDLWVGGQTVLVQLGDILDRGENEVAILSLLKSLGIQAKVNGGAVFQVNGNHETMNVDGDFRYVYSGGFEECADFLEHLKICGHNWEEAFVGWVGVTKKLKEDRRKYWDPWDVMKKHEGVISRSILLRPGGSLASELAQHPVVLKINDWIFCHGGLLPHHVEYGIERMNREVSYWMKGLCTDDDYPQIPFLAIRGYDSVVWSRLYSRETSDLQEYQINQTQSILGETLQALGAKAMVVGHTPQATGVNCKFNCSIWRIDVGMSRGVLDSRPEVLEIHEGKARAIRSRRGASGRNQWFLGIASLDANFGSSVELIPLMVNSTTISFIMKYSCTVLSYNDLEAYTYVFTE